VDPIQFDPFMFGIAGPFVAALNNYLSTELDVKVDQPYVVFSEEAYVGWKRGISPTRGRSWCVTMDFTPTPTGGRAGRRAWRLRRSGSSRRSAALTATHDLDFAARLCRRFITLEGGRIVDDAADLRYARENWEGTEADW
jgi:hypothetical protein